ncbi:hypothetical protein [Polluticoccus soli]|uniref:hypothetical protein n=1 Tax=Polluticoccus soli TaxID=3034150 RepID=UPI0023E14CEE|nr:hypothetical protein [Flavipsychrobacter sp. JY13-12]
MRYTITMIAAFVVLTTTSCVKTYNCVCNEETNTNGTVVKESNTSELNMLRKKDAEEDCNMGDQTINETNFTYKKECELE